jgi:hypothetical protein
MIFLLNYFYHITIKIMRILWLTVVYLISLQSYGQLLKTDGKAIVNDQGEEILLRGVGPGGWQIMEGYMMQTSGVAGSQHEIIEKLIELMGEEQTEVFFNKWRRNHFTQEDVDSLAAWGFNSIRIPMHYNLFTLPIEQEPVGGQNTWIETGFQLIDSVLKWSKPHDIYVILDLHAAPGGQGTGSEINDYDPDKPSLWESDENKAKTVALWTRIAERYKNEPWIGGYDLINEPHWDLPGGTDLRAIYEDITTGIRSVDTNHIIFIEGNWYANDFTGLTPPWDSNMVYSFHKYWSFTNEDDLDWVLPLREEHNIPLWMGESGENSNTWFTDAVKLFEDNNIGWAWWTMRKIGDIDSPYAIDINPGYQRIIDYWAGNGPQPSAEETFNAMMQLAENLLVQNSRYRKDVPDALIRQPHTDATIPYAQHKIPGIIHLSDFDLGKNGIAYSDQDVADYNLSTGSFQAWNAGWAYRNDGVDIQVSEDEHNSNGFHVGFTAKGEWIKYTVEVAEEGTYRAELRTATELPSSKFHLAMNDQPITTSEEVLTSSSWSSFSTHVIEGILLEEGTQELKIFFDNGSFNVSSVEFIKDNDAEEPIFSPLTAQIGDNEQSIRLTTNKSILESSLSNTVENFEVLVNGELQQAAAVELYNDKTVLISLDQAILFTDQVTLGYNGTNVSSVNDEALQSFSNLSVINKLAERFVLPGLIEAEAFEKQAGLAIEETTDTGGGFNIGYTDVGDFADYKIFVRNEGQYMLNLRVASQNQTGQAGFYLIDEIANETELVKLSTPITGGWQTWETVSDTFYLPAGIHTLRMKVLNSGFNMNWFNVTEINLTLGLNPNKEQNTFIYPNPSQGVVNITNSLFDNYMVFSLNGSKLASGVVTQNETINLETLKPGMYRLLLSNDKTNSSKYFNLLITNH